MVTASALAAGLGLLAAAVPANASSPTVPPFTECPAIGASPSCEILLVVNANNSVSVEGDPSVGTFDGSDDTLVGIVNNSGKAVKAVTVTGPGSGLSEFDGDGICSGDYGAWTGSTGCPYGPTGYEGPGTSFVTSPSLPDSAEIDFKHGLAPGGSAYFSLEGALASAHLTARKGSLGFTVNGSIPVAPNATQDTHAQTPGAVCSPRKASVDRYLGEQTAIAFRHLGAPYASGLLVHFLSGKGTPQKFGARSQISGEVAASPEFQALDSTVQAAVLSQLNGGNAQVQLTTPVLSTIRLTSTEDLYLGFRGTQGLTVSGRGKLVNGSYKGKLTYVIQDSYGFNPGYTLSGIGDAMRYLQTICGAPQYPSGAHWFPDSITVVVPFDHPAPAAAPAKAAKQGD